ncbi:Rieske (2Fe-2S) protein [Stutzerimonas kirkiae]|uniref:MFS transporter n=1 Tax=Stutzerimonas kirkiae TaxID=2211392 RepID=A0A4Q9R6Z5_9GAMM|nr:Rieske 2Fe-2S domain-containing protein [Stutzerimonas kirkiae]TBU95774.1 MFS transporter [Stutzerimonas kirkiae]TBV02765.1 MFS transporter [Stutzerimonas kirkiae]TBV03741.1 MFS transporter [Stutzerimonas kirkiae]TBV13278.1 MFS transporter [Stutzerimonas kirkiae]
MIPLCHSTELPEGQSRSFTVNGLALMAIRQHGLAHVYENHCPHRGVRLDWQAGRFLDQSASMIQCAHHGALFLIESGECVAGPCSGDFLRQHPCIEHDGSIWLQSLPQRDS